jgi:hypothetical protein
MALRARNPSHLYAWPPTPIYFEAQAKFHRFYFALAEAVADANEAPKWLPNSPHLPKGAN